VSEGWRRERDSVYRYPQIPEYFRKIETLDPPDLLKTRGAGNKQVQNRYSKRRHPLTGSGNYRRWSFVLSSFSATLSTEAHP
jgi:hypothetical protein